jgi:transposase
MSKSYLPFEPKQKYLLPQSLDEWLPEGHLAYFVQDVVSELNLKAIFDYYERDHRGAPPHHPRMMVGLLVYGYCVGVPWSRKIEQKTYEDVAFRVLAAGQHPDHTRISEFRRIHAAALAGLFVQVLKLCMQAGLVKLGHVSLDGTKLKANGSKHKAMSYDRMKAQEAELSKKVKELLTAAEVADAEDDAKYGKGRRGDELPEELQRAESRLARIREAKAALEAEAKAAHEKEQREKDDPPGGAGGGLPSHQVPHTKEGLPTDKAQRNFTDPESRIQKTNDGFVQGYNAQAVVDERAQVIVAQALTNQSPDPEHLAPMLEQVKQNCGKYPRKLSADTGYYSDANVTQAGACGIDAYIATGRQKHGTSPPPVRGRPPAGLSIRDRMARKLRTKRGRVEYAQRKKIVEPVFGQVKAVRGLRQVVRRGVEAARTEWAFFCTTHNLLKLFRYGMLATA